MHIKKSYCLWFWHNLTHELHVNNILLLWNTKKSQNGRSLDALPVQHTHTNTLTNTITLSISLLRSPTQTNARWNIGQLHITHWNIDDGDDFEWLRIHCIELLLFKCDHIRTHANFLRMAQTFAHFFPMMLFLCLFWLWGFKMFFAYPSGIGPRSK